MDALQKQSKHQQQQQQQQQYTINYNNLPTPVLQGDVCRKSEMKCRPYVKIVEQPAGKALRFRYECEGRSAGSIPGINSTPENKTYPTIEIVGYKGRAVVVVSCVTKNQPFRPHPHNLVGKEGCKKGVCTLEVNSETMRAVFSNLGIQCVKKKDIEAALKAREDIRVDPFKTGFAHRFQPSGIDLNSVRLCFQVFTEGEHKGRFTLPLAPVVSEPIFDKKSMSDLVICRLCSCSATVLGNTQIILLCEKVTKEDISIRFFEEANGQTTWEAYGEFQHSDVHKQTAITFRTPRYHNLDIKEPAKVFIQLKRPSDGATSEPLHFDYIPLDTGRHRFTDLRRHLNRKPDLDIFQKILNTSSEMIEIPTIDLNTPTETDADASKAIPILTTALTTEQATDSTKYSIEQNLDSGIENKSYEVQQQPVVQSHANNMHLDSLQEVIQIMNNDANDAYDGSQLLAEPMPEATANEKIKEWMQTNDLQPQANDKFQTSMSLEDKTLDDILEQVAELDEIYPKHVTRSDNYNNTLLNELNGMDTCVGSTDISTNVLNGMHTSMDVEDNFDDAATYSSLQFAFKNPIDIPLDAILPSMPLQSSAPPRPPLAKFHSPHMHVTSAEEEKVPPLPPKRLRKQDSNAENRSIEANTGETVNKSRFSPTPIIIMKTPDQSPLPKRSAAKHNQKDSSMSPKQKKNGFFSKLFSRRKRKTELNPSLEQNLPSASGILVNNSSLDTLPLSASNCDSMNSSNSFQAASLPTSPTKVSKKAGGSALGRSASSVSGKRPTHLHPGTIHISLKRDEDYSQASTLTLSNTLDRRTVSALQLADIPISDGNIELVAIADRQSLRNLCEGEFNVRLDPNVDLSEAEHFALYTSIPPQATASEFDEISACNTPVEDVLTSEEVAKRLVAANFKN